MFYSRSARNDVRRARRNPQAARAELYRACRSGPLSESLEVRRLLAADVAILKTDSPDPVFAGNNLTYTIIVSNNGDVATGSITATDNLPVSTRFVSATQTAGPAFTVTTPTVGQAGGTFTATAGSFASGLSATFDVVVAVPANTANATTINNTATVSAVGDSNATNDTATATTAVNTRADLSVVKTGPATILVGNNVTYTVTLTNNGPSDAQAVTLTDVLPAGETFVSQTQTAGPIFTKANTGNTINDSIATLASGAVATFSFVASVPQATPNNTVFNNTATTGSTTNDPVSSNNSSLASTTAQSPADLKVTKTGPAGIIAGNNITYTLTVQNIGGVTATNISLTDILPTGETFISQNQTAGPAFTNSNTGNTINDTIASLAGGASATFSVLAKVGSDVPNAATLSNTASASMSQTDPTPADDSATSNASVSAQADVTIAKLDSPDPVTAGTDLTYTITVGNSGSSDAQNVSLSDTLPAGVTFISETQTNGPTFTVITPAVGSGGTVSGTIPTLVAGAASRFVVVVRVNSAAANGSTITNTATASSTTTDPVPSNNTSTAPTAVVTSADLSAVKTVVGGPFREGDNITWQVVVTNNGPSDAQGVTLTDAVPAGTTFMSAPGVSGFTTAAPAIGGTGNVVFSGGTIAAGGTRTFNIVVNAPEEGPVTNTATVSSTTSDANGANNASTASVTVQDQLLTIRAQPPLAGVEGNSIFGLTVATFTDGKANEPVSEYNATIDWGDGSAPDTSAIIAAGPGGIYYVLGTHTYIEEGKYSVHVGIHDIGGSQTAADEFATIADAPLSGSAINFNAVEGTTTPSTTQVARFTDFNPLSTTPSEYSTFIQWGDGGGTFGTIVTDGVGGFIVQGSHKYVVNGTYNTTVAVLDEGGATITLHGIATVADAPLTPIGRSFTATHGLSFTKVIGSFGDADSSNRNASIYRVLIDWGDGTAKTLGTVKFNTATFKWDVTGTHKYTLKSPVGGYRVKILVTDGFGKLPPFSQSTTIASTAIVS